MKPLRVGMDALQVGPAPAGVGQYVIELVRALDPLLGPSERLTVYASAAAADLTSLPLNRTELALQPTLRTPLRILRQQLVLPRLMRGRVDVAHYPDYLVPIWGRPRPCVVNLHDLSYFASPDYFTAGQRALRLWASPRAVRGADRILALSRFTRDELVRVFPDLPPERIRVVYPGVRRLADGPAGDIEGLRRRLMIPREYVLSVGTLEPRKNLVRLLQAFGRPELAGQHLVLVGRKGWGREFGRGGAGVPREVLGRLTVTGFLNDAELAALYQHAAVFAYVSLYEGFGLPVVEAMSVGGPVVASDIPVLREIGGDAARFVDPASPEAIAKAIAQLLADGEQRARLAELGRRNAARFTWSRCAGEVLETYRELAASARDQASSL